MTMASPSVSAQSILRLRTLGNGERVRLSYRSRSKTVNLAKDFGVLSFAPGGDPPHRYQVLLSFQRNGNLYLVARFRSRSRITDGFACTNDIPWTLLLIKTKGLQVEEVATQVYDWCVQSGGAKATGPLRVTKDGIVVNYVEAEEPYTLRFVPGEAEKGFQISKR